MLLIYMIGIVNFIYSVKPIFDPDYGWHISVGRYIFENHIIPECDIFSWYGKLNNLEFTSHEWLSDLIMYIIGDVGNIILLSIFILLFYFIIIKLLKMDKKINVSYFIKVGFAIISTILFGGIVHRPYLFSYLFFSIFLVIIFKYLNHRLKNNKLLYVIPVFQLLWVNIHGGSSSLIPLMLLIIIILSLIFSKYRDIDIIKKLSFILMLSCIFSLINPYGYKILIYPFTNMGDTTMINYISEWASPSFHGMNGIYYFLIIIIPMFVLVLNDKKNISIIDVFFYLMFLFMSFRSVRFFHYYIFISAYIVGKYLKDDLISFNFNKKFKINLKIVKIFIVIIFMILCTYIVIMEKSNFTIRSGSFYSDKSIDVLIKLEPKKIYNDYNSGGYLTEKLYDSDIDIFINGIADIYTSNIFLDSFNLEYLNSNPEEILSKYDFDAIIIRRGLPLEYYLIECDIYDEYYSDDTAIIFKKV